MSIQTNLMGRLRNTPLPLTSGLLPLFEAVVNSIHSIEEAGMNNDAGRIDITIQRKPKQQQLVLVEGKKKKGPEAQEDIIGFEIKDNGIGFTEANMSSFHTLDSEHKVEKGCRGVGRLLWLKAFEKVSVSSVFYGEFQKLHKRQFTFTSIGGVNETSQKLLEELEQRETHITLHGFFPKYRNYARKTTESIADCILEHCLWYFIRPGSAPLIRVWDDGESITLNDLFDNRMHSNAVSQTIELKGHKFELTHVKLRTNSLLAHTIAYCADKRLVMEERLAGKIPGLHGNLSDDNGEFIYSCYVSSPFLDDAVRAERTGFDIPESGEGLFADAELGLKDIRDTIIEHARSQLASHLEANLVRAKEVLPVF